jgi:hypothetical protein
MCTSIAIYMYIFICIYLYIYIYVCTSICMHTCTYIYFHRHDLIHLWLYMNISNYFDDDKNDDNYSNKLQQKMS